MNLSIGANTHCIDNSSSDNNIHKYNLSAVVTEQQETNRLHVSK